MLLDKLYKFAIGGIISYGLKIFLTALFTEYFLIHYLISYSIVLLVLIIYTFAYNKHITFKSKSPRKFRYLLLFFGFIVSDLILVYLLTELLAINYLISIILVTTVLFILKFIIYDKFIFIKQEREYVPVAGNYYDKHNSRNPIVKFLMRNFHSYLFKLIGEVNPNSLLDVGCGEGYTTKRIQKFFSNVKIKGVEYEKEALKLSLKNPEGIDFIEGNIYDLDETDDSFDLVIATEVLEHLENPALAVKETRRVAKNYCIYTVPYEPFWRVANMLRGRYLKDFGNTPGHINHWSRRGLKKLLKPHFKDVKIKNCYLWNMALCKK